MIKRLFASYIDYSLILWIVFPIVFLIDSNFVWRFDYLFAIVSVLFLAKDLFFKNASLGKRIFRLEVLTLNDKKPNFSQLIFRNIFIVIWPIELILLLLFGKRLGDIIFGTKVVNKKN